MPRLLLAVVGVLTVAGASTAQPPDKPASAPKGGTQLIGFGLVVGLDGTGSRSTFTQQVAVDLMQRLGVMPTTFPLVGMTESFGCRGLADRLGPSSVARRVTSLAGIFRSPNISAVMVTADIGPWVRKGGKIDVTVSSMDDARSLQGGQLLLTPLKGADGEVYAVGQGPLSVDRDRGDESLTVGRGAGGAVVVRAAK